MARVSVSAFIVVYNIIPKLIATVEANSMSAPKKVADKVVIDARSRAPVETGFLRSSISAVSLERGKTAEVQVGAEYAPYIEYGTYKMAAQPFLAPALEAHAEELGLEIISPLL